MSATEVVETELGRTGESEPEQNEQEGSGAFLEGGTRLTDEEVSILTNFITQAPEDEVELTAQQKRLAKQRARVEAHRNLLIQFGHELDNDERRFDIEEGGRTHKVAAREFMMRKWLKIRNKNGRLQGLRVNAVQREYAKTAAKRNIVLKARQLGITTYVAARFFMNCITRPGTLCVQVAHDQRSAEEIFRIVHRLLANLPDYMRKGALTTSHANVRQIVFPHMDSSYRVETASENAGRGLTIQNLHCSEVSRWPGDAAATLAALRAAVPPDGEIVLESTANGAGGCFYEEWQRAEQMGYSRHFFPWWWEPTYKRAVEIVQFTDDEVDLMKKFGLTAEQIAFRREIRANFGRRAAEEFAEDAESCFLASGDCVFDVEVIEQRLKEGSEIIDQQDGGKLLYFLPAKAGKEYIMGVDPAGGGSAGDYSVAEVIDRASGAQCAELRGHLTRQELAARVSILARQYNHALVAVERNNHGHEVLAHLAMSHADVPVYHQKGEAGWLTSAASRPRMLQNLAAVLAAAPYVFNSTRLLEECKTFVRRPDGSTAAANGAHDDTVMAMAIALAVRAEVVGRAHAAGAQMEVATL
ncbi:MAG TPA: terminase [Candidatus Eisenbacteria bacterium]|nr:terminase [Candidatus Eisenbacteria bacterium]